MSYWIDLFTGTTWEEFQKAGSRITGFRRSMRKPVSKVKPGDIFLCYLTGVKRWVGALEVVGRSDDRTPIWQDEEFPVRFEVKPLIVLAPEHGVPMEELEGRVSFYRGPMDRGKYLGFVRSSPRRFARHEDGDLIMKLLQEARDNPVSRPVDPRKLARKPVYRVSRKKGRREVEMVVSVPEPEDVAPVGQVEATAVATDQPEQRRHTEMQYYLIKLGADLGLDVWVARNDRSREFNGQLLKDLPGVVSELPTQFNEATTRTIEFIDVLWLRGRSIVAAFEVEATTSVVAGLLRMADLLALQPNLDIRLYIVAPDERRDKVEQEILRPTFAILDKPLPEVCGFIPFSRLKKYAEAIRDLGLARSLRPDFLADLAEYFEPEGE